MSQTTDFSFNGVPAGMRQMRRLVETGSQDHKTTDTYMNKYRYRQRKGMTRTFQNPEERPTLSFHYHIRNFCSTFLRNCANNRKSTKAIILITTVVILVIYFLLFVFLVNLAPLSQDTLNSGLRRRLGIGV